MRTTIRLDDELLRRAKQRAQLSGKTLTQLIEEALRESIDRREKVKTGGSVKLITTGEGGLQPGVDLDDSAALLDVMDDDHHAAT